MGVIVAQFFAALNDNAMRQAFLLLAVTSAQAELQATATAVFALPFLLFSLLAGQIADRFSKRTVIIGAKTIEIGIVLLGGYALYANSLPILLTSILLMATQSTFFSPAKYGILPEILTDRDLSSGNSLLQTTTYAAILIGTAATGVLLQFGSALYLGGVLVVFGLIGWVASLFVDPVPAAGNEAVSINPLSELASELSRIRADSTLFLAMLGYAYAWLVGTVLVLNLNVYGLKTLDLGQAMTSLMLVFLATGMGVGSLLAGRWTERTVEPGLIPFGAVGMASSLFVFINSTLSPLSAAFWLLMVGVFSGLFLIPLQTLLQERPESGDVGSTFGVTNVVTFSAVLTAAAVYAQLSAAGLAPTVVMGALALSTCLVAVFIVTVVPAFFFRFIVWLITHTIYRIDVFGEDNIPHNGPAILAPNHVSYVDGLLIAACVPRFVRFIVYGPLFDIPIIGWVLRAANAIPVYPGDDEQIEKAMQTARTALNDGHVVCIFPEGAVTRTGQMRSVKRGVERLAQSTKAPVVPVRLDQLWGSIFSHWRSIWQLPERLPYPVNIAFGSPISAAETNRVRVRQDLDDLGVRARQHEASEASPLIEQVVRTAHRHPFTTALYDAAKQREITFFGLLSRALTLRSVLPESFERERIGVCVDDRPTALMMNLALNLKGSVTANLPDNELSERSRELDLSALITTDTPHTARKDELECRVLTVAELIERIGTTDQIKGRLTACSPTRLIASLTNIPDNERTLTIVYTRGRTGPEKPVCLSGRSVLATIQSIQSVLSLQSGRPIIAPPPTYRSLGLIVGLYLPLITGCGVVKPRPDLPFEEAAEASVVIGSPEHYQNWLKTGAKPPEPAPHLLTGGDPVPEALEKQINDDWGQSLLVGYGCTEIGAVSNLNLPDVNRKEGSIIEQGHKPGSVGRTIPGAAVKIVNEDGKECSPGEEGRVLLRAAGFMNGYAGEYQSTMRERWFVTADRGYVDDDGFLYWTGREC